jgi:ATP-dependent helicase HrpB
VTELPIESIAAGLVDSLEASVNFVLQAEPGAGKTTRVPVILLEAGVADAGEIWVSQPRRIAARMAASRVAYQLGEPVGRTCGYQVRFETKASGATKIRFMTEGLLARRLREDPKLSGVGAVLLDEFHERHIDADVSLALLRRLQHGPRPDLRIGVMSATLDPDAVAAYLGGPALRCPGRTHPVEIEYEDKVSDRPLTTRVSRALTTLGERNIRGSVLVFLPGAREIRDVLEACGGQARHLGLQPVALHGDLPAAEQDAAVATDTGPKLIATTNLAETSLTIDGVVAVIDSGLARKPSFDPWSGVPRLTLAKVSQASAIQRAGRAGRTGPGHCVRLFTRPDFERRPAFDEPELQRLDLAQAMLDLRAAGLTDPRTLDWFEPPPQASLEAAEDLLRRLDAVQTDGGLTDAGTQMLKIPAHPRLARVMTEAHDRGIGATGATIAALLSERPIRRRTASARRRDAGGTAADVLVDAEALRQFERDPGAARRLDLDAGACRNVLRVRRQLAGAVGARGDRRDVDIDEAVGYATMAGFPDRIGAVRDEGRRVAFAYGGSAELPEDSAAAGSELVVVLDVEERRSAGGRARTFVRSAVPIDADWLLDLLIEHVEERRSVTFDEERERVEATEDIVYGSLVLESRRLDELPPEATEVLRAAARAKGASAFVGDPEALSNLQARTTFAHSHDPRVAPVTATDIEAALDAACEGRASFAELRRADLLQQVMGVMDPAARASLERLAPITVTLPGGRRLGVHYELDRPPWVQSRLQDFFGSTDGPRIADGRQPVVLHLLAPNRRAVQVTTDLAGFWERHYPDLRKQLMRRYPKHDWPEDAVHATPPKPGRARRPR